jgi:hypothetical protein
MKWIALSLLIAAAADAQPLPPPPPPAAEAATPVQRQGTIDRLLLSPAGDVDGLLLTDGTVARLPPGALEPGELPPGQRVRLSGFQDGNELRTIRIDAGNRTIVIANGGPRGRRPPPPPPPDPTRAPAP